MFRRVPFKEAQLMIAKTDYPMFAVVKEGNWAFIEIGVRDGVLRVPFVDEVLFEEEEPGDDL